MNDFLNRDFVLGKAIEDCYREMFAKAQPSADWDNLIAEYKAGKINEDKDGPIYNRHYLSTQEYIYIVDKYLEAYHIKSDWKEHIDILKEYLENGGSKDKYIEGYEDEYGSHPGYRGYEKVDPLKDHIKTIIDTYLKNKELDQTREQITQDVVNKVMEIINTCQDFYHFNIDEMKFRNTLALGSSPTSNKKTVKDWWKEHYDIDIEIEDRNPLLLWEYDNYGDEMDSIMKDEYGDNWKEIWDAKWEAELVKRKAKNEKLINELKENNESDNK